MSTIVMGAAFALVALVLLVMLIRSARAGVDQLVDHSRKGDRYRDR